MSVKETNLPPLVANVWGSVAHISFDVIALLLLFIALAALCFYIGKSKSIAVLLASYLSLFLFKVIPFQNKLDSAPVTLIAFATLWGILFLVVKNFMFAEFPYTFLRKAVQAAFLGLSILIIILTASYHFLPVEKIYHFSKAIDPLFAPNGYTFYWLIAPFLVLFGITRR